MLAFEATYSRALGAVGMADAVQLSGMHHALIHEQERSESAWALEWMLLPQMAVTTSRALSAAITLTGQITAMGVSEK